MIPGNGGVSFASGFFQKIGNDRHNQKGTGVYTSGYINAKASYNVPTTSTENRPNNFNIKIYIKL